MELHRLRTKCDQRPSGKSRGAGDRVLFLGGQKRDAEGSVRDGFPIFQRYLGGLEGLVRLGAEPSYSLAGNRIDRVHSMIKQKKRHHSLSNFLAFVSRIISLSSSGMSKSFTVFSVSATHLSPLSGPKG